MIPSGCGYGGALQNVACGPEARAPEVHAWMESITFSSNRINELLDQLSERLQPVLGVNAENRCDDKQPPAASPLGQAIQVEVIRLNDIEAQLSSLLRRLEI